MMWHQGSALYAVDDAANGVSSLCSDPSFKTAIQKKVRSIRVGWGHQCDLKAGKGADSQTPACQHPTYTLSGGVLSVEVHEVNPTFGTSGPGNLREWLSPQL